MKGKTKIRCHECAHWQRGLTGMEGICIKYETATGAQFTCEGAAVKGGDKERAEKIRGHMEDMVRIANRHGYLMRQCISDGHRIMQHRDTDQVLEIELLEMT
jgi:hypothetical protein